MIGNALEGARVREPPEQKSCHDYRPYFGTAPAQDASDQSQGKGNRSDGSADVSGEQTTATAIGRGKTRRKDDVWKDSSGEPTAPSHMCAQGVVDQRVTR